MMKNRILSILIALAMIVSLVPSVVFAAEVPEAMRGYEGYWEGADQDGNHAELNLRSYNTVYSRYDATLRWEYGDKLLFISFSIRLNAGEVVIDSLICKDVENESPISFTSGTTSLDPVTGIWTLSFTGDDLTVTFTLEKLDVEMNASGVVEPQEFNAVKQSGGAWQITVDGTLSEGEMWGCVIAPSLLPLSAIAGLPMNVGASMLVGQLMFQFMDQYLNKPIALQDSMLGIEGEALMFSMYGIELITWSDGNTITIDKGELSELFVFKMTDDDGPVDSEGCKNIVLTFGGALISPNSEYLSNQAYIPATSNPNVTVAAVTDSQGNGIGGTDGSFTNLDDALTAALSYSGVNTPVTVSVKNNTEITNGPNVVNKDIIFDLNGCIISAQVLGESIFEVEKYAALTITDTSDAKNGTLVCSGTGHEYMVSNAGELVLQNGMLMGYSGFINTESGCGGVFVDDGLFYMIGGMIGGMSAECGAGVYISGGAVTMEGGEISGNTGISNSNPYGGGVLVENGGVFTMNAGKIRGNLSGAGGGVMVGNDETASFIMKGGEISDNMTLMLGGAGVMVVNGSTFHADGGKIARNMALCMSLLGAAGGVYIAQEDDALLTCLAEGTPVTLADGSRAAVENLKPGDVVRVFDHETGELSTAKLFVAEKIPTTFGKAFTLHFTNDIDVTAVSSHCFFDKEENRYVSIKRENAEDYIGHQFYNADEDRWETLESVSYIIEPVVAYSIETEKTLNAIANGMLSNGDAIYRVMINVFDFDDELKIDADKKAADIAEYGLYDFSETQYATRETFDALNLQYVRVAIGKGMITPEQLAGAGEYQEDHNKELVRSDETSGTEMPIEKTESVLMSSPEPLPLAADPASESLIIIGGDLQVTQNLSLPMMADDSVNVMNSNFMIWNDEGAPEIVLGTKTTGPAAPEDNGVLAPANMRIGITIGVNGHAAPPESPQIPAGGVFLKSAVEGDKAYFFSDSSDYYLYFDAANSELELCETADADKYDLWVGGTQVTSYNRDDVLLDGGSAKYDVDGHVLTLTNATIAGSAFDAAMTGIKDELEELTIKLIGQNTIGRESDWSVNWYENSTQMPAVLNGIDGYNEATGEYGTIKFIGDSSSSLNIYDIIAGIRAGNAEFGSDFKGTLNIYDYGASMEPGCAINAVGEYESEAYVGGGEVTIKGGTLNLFSKHSNGIYADGNISVENAAVNVISGGPDANESGDMINGIYCLNDMSINNSNISVSANAKEYGQVAGIFCMAMMITDSSVTAEAMSDIDAGHSFGLWVKSLNVSGDESEVKVTAIAGQSAGIYSTPGKIVITGGTVEAKGSMFAIADFSGAEDALCIGTAEKPAVLENATICKSGDGNQFLTVEAITQASGSLAVFNDDSYDAILVATSDTENDGYVKISIAEPEPETKHHRSTFSEDDIRKEEYKMAFEDVQETAYYYDAVKWAASKGITMGTTEVTYSPEKPITRAQAITFLWRAAGSPIVDYAMNMSDVSGNEYYAEAVRWALSVGITKGTGASAFSPDDICPRKQIITFLANYAGADNTDTASGFVDVNETDYFAAAVRWAKENGIANGTAADRFSPNVPCSRAQAVTFLYRLMVK